jgi:lipoprotein-anchoring transpeptidase ErfK/SrfK
MKGRLFALLAMTAASVVWTAPARAQLPVEPLALEHGGEPNGPAAYAEAPVSTEGRYITVSLEEHRLRLMEGRQVVFETIVGTGTGTRLEGAGQRWEFSTPRGMFRVQSKEKDPKWYVPDWEFIELKQPIPPADSPLRWQSGMLGTSALYLGEGIALHGTSKPELLGQNVSHGCIRMSNEAARQLYHSVEVGTPVFIY